MMKMSVKDMKRGKDKPRATVIRSKKLTLETGTSWIGVNCVIGWKARPSQVGLMFEEGSATEGPPAEETTKSTDQHILLVRSDSRQEVKVTCTRFDKINAPLLGFGNAFFKAKSPTSWPCRTSAPFRTGHETSPSSILNPSSFRRDVLLFSASMHRRHGGGL